MYDKFEFEGQVYKVGDYLLLRETTITTIVGKLLKIVPQGGHPANPDWPMIQVHWFYKKSDLNINKLSISPTDFKRFIGENEIFPCEEHSDMIFADAIIGKAQVYQIKEYDEIQQIDINTTFFTRAHYNPMKKELTPSYAQWEKLCVCKKPLNPNLQYINCDKCNNWFHPECMKLSNNVELQNLAEFFCTNCRQ